VKVQGQGSGVEGLGFRDRHVVVTHAFLSPATLRRAGCRGDSAPSSPHTCAASLNCLPPLDRRRQPDLRLKP